MLSAFAQEKETFLTLKNRIFERPKKSQFFLYLHLVKIRVEILLSDFGEKKETFFWL